jgi:hypothetical protein
MNRLVTIERKKLDPNLAYGGIVSESPALTLLHQEVDFQFDGYVAFRTKDITRREPSDANHHCQRLMRREGLWEPVPRWVKKLSVTGWPELIADLVGKVVVLEDELRDEFYIGPILEVGSKKVVVHYFDPCGRLRNAENVLYSRITSMKFGDRYSTIYAKYLTADGQTTGPTDLLDRPMGKR